MNTDIAPGTILAGSVVTSNDYGDWAIVPDVNGELWVSSTGWTWQYDIHSKKWYAPHKNAPKPVKGDVIVSHRGKTYRVHILMGLAFFGPRPTASHTIDHIQKYDGDLVKERSDNRIENLRWATKHQQSLNRNPQVERRDGRPVLLWMVGSDRSTGREYHSSLAASKDLGINAGSVSRAAKINSERSETDQKKSVGGWHVLFANDREPLRIAEDEEFREKLGFFVSQYGRALDTQTRAFAFTPMPRKGNEYAIISKRVDEKSVASAFHSIVAAAWPELVEGKPGPGMTLDHRNRDKTDNRAENLRWADYSTQNTNKIVAQTVRRQSRAVQLLPPGETTWLNFNTMVAASSKVPFSTLTTSLRMNPAGRRITKGPHSGWTIRERP